MRHLASHDRRGSKGMNRCPKCGKNMDLVGSRHDCRTTSPFPPNDRIADYGDLGQTPPGPAVGCPVCEERKVKQREAQRRYREKHKV